MNQVNLNNIINTAISNIDWTIDNVLKRGYRDVEEEVEDYSRLIEKYEIHKMITFELYENYFPPRRHEFELQILEVIIEAVIKHHNTMAFIGAAAVSGVIGNSVYDLIKKIVSHISHKFSKNDEKRSKIFLRLKSDVTLLEDYFKGRNSANIEDLEINLKIERERLIPLLKMLGFKLYKRKKSRIWVKPETQ